MRKIEWIKGVLDWIIRLQGAYTILATILAGSIGVALRAVLSAFTKLPEVWITPIWMFFFAVVLGGFFVWGSKLGSFVNYPDFDLGISTMIWLYDAPNDLTRFYLGARLVNRGAPSITQYWTATYSAGGSVEEMKGYYLVGPAAVIVGHERLTMNNEDLLNVKTAETAVERGGASHGRLLFTLQGNRDTQVSGLQFRIQIKMQDYTARNYTALYIPSARPTPGLLRHPLERGEFINPTEHAPGDGA